MSPFLLVERKRAESTRPCLSKHPHRAAVAWISYAVVAGALLGCLNGCGEDCVGLSSFTDENGLIVFVACDGTTFVATPTPASND